MSPIAAEARPYVEGPNVAHLATLLPDGAPHSVPVWVGFEGERIAFLTDPRSQKGRNVARDPRVSLSITLHDRPNAMTQIQGRVVDVVEGDPAWAIIDRLSEQYIGQPYPREFDRVVYLIEPERSFTFAPE
jgi:PPOX class probable F420-dependent enzyme